MARLLTMKKTIFLIFLVSLVFISPVDSVNFECTITTTPCLSPIMKLAQLEDSHVGSPNSNFPYYVCCEGYGITNSCGSPILKQIQSEDSHVKTTGDGVDICVSHPNGVSCTVRDNDCEAEEICIVSLAGNDEYHVGECSVYSKKLCCDTGNQACILEGDVCTNSPEDCCNGLNCVGEVNKLCVDCLDEGQTCSNDAYCCGAGMENGGGYCSSGHCCKDGDFWNGIACEETTECLPSPCPYDPQDNFVLWLGTQGCFLGQPQPTEACCLADLYGGEGYYFTDIEVY